MSEAHQAVFLSYASQDAEAAKRICDALRVAGVEVWFDQSELRGGDAWDAMIRKRIKDCALFVPVISVNTQARAEGYFRREWKLAVERTHDMADHVAFLLPVVLDATTDREAHVPEKFREVQWTRLPGGETPPAFCQRVKKLLGGETVAGVADPGRPGSATPAASKQSSPKKGKPAWLRFTWVGAGILLALIYAVRPLWQTTRPAETKPAAVAQAAAATEAQKLVAQARQIYEDGDELDRENLFLAEDLVKRALALDSAEPAAWELGAWLSYAMVWQSIDNTGARRDLMMRQATRARTLAPQSVSAQLVLLYARLAMNFATTAVAQSSDLPEIERELAALARQEPANWRIQRALGTTLRLLNRPDDSVRTMQRAVELSAGDVAVTGDLVNVLMRRSRFSEAEALVAPALARRATGRMLTFDQYFKLMWRGDLAAAQAALEAWPGWLMQEDRGVFYAWRAWMYSRRPEKALTLVQRLQRDYLRDANFTGPRAVLSAQAHELAGHADAAAADWRTVVQLADRELAVTPDDDAAAYWKAWALARLGDIPGARTIGNLLQQRQVAALTSFHKSTSMAPLWSVLGQTDLAFAVLGTRSTAYNDSLPVTRATLELDPAYDALRPDPRFKDIVAAAPAPEKKNPAIALKADDKSIAVLPFENMSEEKDSAFFTDGIHEDILTNLALIRELRVVSRTSVMQYRGTTKTMKQLAQELGVTYILEGSVRRSGNKVRVTGQLIHAATDEHVWAQSYDRDLTDVFTIQSELSAQIAGALKAALSPEEKALIERRPTENTTAYDLYLKARERFARVHAGGLSGGGSSGERELEIETLLQAAVKLDPNFVDAWLALATTHGFFYAGNVDHSATRLAKAKAAIDRAVALAPDSPAVIAVLGGYYMNFENNYDRAAEQFEKALRLQPNSGMNFFNLGILQRKQGRWSEALASLRKAIQLDPAFADSASLLALTLHQVRRFDEEAAERRRIVARWPERKAEAMSLALLEDSIDGTTRATDALIARLEASEADRPRATALRKEQAARRSDFAAFIRLDRQQPYFDGDGGAHYFQALVAAGVYFASGDTAAARARLENFPAELRKRLENEPTNPRLWQDVGQMEVILGHNEEAVRCARKAVDLAVTEPDADRGPLRRANLAAVYAWTGDKDRAIAELTGLLQAPSFASGYVLRTSPVFFPLRGDPRFEALVNDPKNNKPVF